MDANTHTHTQSGEQTLIVKEQVTAMVLVKQQNLILIKHIDPSCQDAGNVDDK